MLTFATDDKVAGIVSELERVLVDRQALVYHLEAFVGRETEAAGLCAALTERLGRVILRQKLLLDELAVLRPPVGHAGVD